MGLLFSQRYKELIRDVSRDESNQFLDSIDYSIRHTIAGVLLDFREPHRFQPDRYNSLTVEVDALISATERLKETYGYEAINFLFGMGPGCRGEDERACPSSQPTALVFDLVELLVDELSDSEEDRKSDFRAEVNVVFGNNDIPWVLVVGRMVKINSKQFEQGMKGKVLMSLPFIRNFPGAVHGAGAGNREIPKSMTNLTVNLACALDTYIADEWASGQQDDRDLGKP